MCKQARKSSEDTQAAGYARFEKFGPGLGQKCLGSKKLGDGGNLLSDGGDLLADGGDLLGNGGDLLGHGGHHNVISTLCEGSEVLTEWKTQKNVTGVQRLFSVIPD